MVRYPYEQDDFAGGIETLEFCSLVIISKVKHFIGGTKDNQNYC